MTPAEFLAPDLRLVYYIAVVILMIMMCSNVSGSLSRRRPPLNHIQRQPQPSVGFGWGSSSISGTSALRFFLSAYASVTALELKFPFGESYSFDLKVYDETDAAVTLEVM